MIKLKSADDIEILREGGQRLATVLSKVKDAVKPGLTTAELNDLAAKIIAEYGDEASFLNYRPTGARTAYPASLCVSINNEVVHGIPSDRVINSGDVVSLDLGLKHQGLFTDTACTIVVGEVPPEVKKLITVTEEAMYAGIKAAKAGAYTGDIGAAVEAHIKPHGYGIVEDLCGHGVGYAVHEDPQVPNFGRPGTGDRLAAGMVIAIEPMVNLGRPDVKMLNDGYTFVTKDGSVSAHFEHTIVITEKGAEVLTANSRK
jgi:methionyl aminopeptidase